MITFCFFWYDIGDTVTVSMVTPDIVYIPTLKGTVLSLLFLFSEFYSLIWVMKLKYRGNKRAYLNHT